MSKTGLFKFIILSVIFSLIAWQLIGLGKTKLVPVRMIDSKGNTHPFSLSFQSLGDGNLGVSSYMLTIEKGIMFSGSLHIIPDDCVVDITLDGNSVLAAGLAGDPCDNLNGIYLSSEMIPAGARQLVIKVDNKQGLFGLSVTDTTFYEGYWLLAVAVFSLFFLPITTTFAAIGREIRSFWRLQKMEIAVSVFLALTFMLTLCFGWKYMGSSRFRWVVLHELILLFTLPLLIGVYRNFLFGKVVAIGYALLIVICSAYLHTLFYDMFSYDVDGHIEYISYLIRTEESPVAGGGWLFYHPSFYYRLAAGFWKMVDHSGLLNYEEFLKMMQGFSLLLFTMYVYFSLKTIDLFFRYLLAGRKPAEMRRKEKAAYLLTVGIFVAWPSNPVFSVRIGNDILFDLLFAACFYFMAKWWYLKKERYFLFMLCLASLAVWTKSNGFILFGLAGGLAAYNLLKAFIVKRGKVAAFLKISAIGLFFAAAFYLSFVRNGRISAGGNVVVANAGGIGSDMVVGKKITNFLPFAPSDFVRIPFTNALDDAKGRQNFWFFLFKTGLFGEFPYKPALMAYIASVISVLFLVLTLFFFRSVPMIFRDMVKHLPFILSILGLVAAMVLFRLLYPYACSSDFRYIYPALLPFSVLVSVGFCGFVSNRKLGIISLALIIPFLGLSFVFQLLNLITL